jgi:hypothetical protein
MLKREITFTNFDGEKVTETHFFHLSKTELVEMEVETNEGFQARMAKIIASKNNKDLIKEFKQIILMSYGEKSEDGKRFIKNDELRDNFSQTGAYDQLFIELATDDKAAAEFIIGVVPKDLAEEALKSGEMPIARVDQKTTAQLSESLAAAQPKES